MVSKKEVDELSARAYEPMQTIIGKILKTSDFFTKGMLGAMFYGEKYNPDSLVQHAVITTVIDMGCKKSQYEQDQIFKSVNKIEDTAEYKEIEYYQNDSNKIDSKNNLALANYYNKALDGRLKINPLDTPELPLYRKWHSKQVQKVAEMGHHDVVNVSPTYRVGLYILASDLEKVDPVVERKIKIATKSLRTRISKGVKAGTMMSSGNSLIDDIPNIFSSTEQKLMEYFEKEYVALPEPNNSSDKT